MQMHDLEENRGRNAAEDTASEPPFLSLDGTTEPKPRANPLHAIAWMIVNTLATVGIASNPQNTRDAGMYICLLTNATGLHQQGHILGAAMEAISAYVRFYPFPHDLVSPFYSFSITIWHLRTSPCSQAAPNPSGYCDVLQRHSAESIVGLLNRHILPNCTNTADTNGRHHELPLIRQQSSQRSYPLPNPCLCRGRFGYIL